MVRWTALLAVMVAATLAFAETSQAEVKLQLKYKENTTRQTEVSQSVQQLMTINGMELITNVTSTTTMSSAIGRRQPDGRLPIETKIESVFSQMQLPMGLELTFDSNNPDVKPANEALQPLVDMMRALAGSKYTIVVDEKNRAVSVRGTEEVLAATNEDTRALLKNLLSADYLKQAYNQEIDRFPTEAVNKGDTWLRNEVVRLGGGQKFGFETLYEYTGTVEKEGKTLDRITSTTTSVLYEMDADSASLAKITQSNLSVEDSGGTLFFDREQGSVIESKAKIHIKGDLTMMINGRELPVELDLTMENQTLVKE